MKETVQQAAEAFVSKFCALVYYHGEAAHKAAFAGFMAGHAYAGDLRHIQEFKKVLLLIERYRKELGDIENHCANHVYNNVREYLAGIYDPSDAVCDQIDEKEVRMNPEQLAQRFHEIYEKLAPQFGYETRKESAKPWNEVPEKNKQLMIAVCKEILSESPSDAVEPPDPFIQKHLIKIKEMTFNNLIEFQFEKQRHLMERSIGYFLAGGIVSGMFLDAIREVFKIGGNWPNTSSKPDAVESEAVAGILDIQSGGKVLEIGGTSKRGYYFIRVGEGREVHDILIDEAQADLIIQKLTSLKNKTS